MSDKDYYGILGLSKHASADDIKRAYRKLAMQYHPDLNRGKEEWANDKFKEINEAFCALGDPEKRRLYDHFGSTWNTGYTSGDRDARAAAEDLMNEIDGTGLKFDSIGDFFGEDLSGTGFAAWRFRRRFRGPGGTEFGTQSNADFQR